MSINLDLIFSTVLSLLCELSENKLVSISQNIQTQPVSTWRHEHGTAPTKKRESGSIIAEFIEIYPE